ncbi:MAG: hypothetical protein P4L51_28260 [Puia sp.]|nr:hypothetical protein [Puia sp.]
MLIDWMKKLAVSMGPQAGKRVSTSGSGSRLAIPLQATRDLRRNVFGADVVITTHREDRLDNKAVNVLGLACQEMVSVFISNTAPYKTQRVWLFIDYQTADNQPFFTVRWDYIDGDDFVYGPKDGNWKNLGMGIRVVARDKHLPVNLLFSLVSWALENIEKLKEDRNEGTALTPEDISNILKETSIFSSANANASSLR